MSEECENVRGLTQGEAAGVEIRHNAPMRLKSYEIDGRVLRSGAANFSASGLKPKAGFAFGEALIPTQYTS
jgi:hypothetical protein